MSGKCRPSLLRKTLGNVMWSNLSITDKECIKAVFERFVPVVRCKDCYQHGECMTEDAFHWSGIQNPYCAAGKQRDGA